MSKKRSSLCRYNQETYDEDKHGQYPVEDQKSHVVYFGLKCHIFKPATLYWLLEILFSILDWFDCQLKNRIVKSDPSWLLSFVKEECMIESVSDFCNEVFCNLWSFLDIKIEVLWDPNGLTLKILLRHLFLQDVHKLSIGPCLVVLDHVPALADNHVEICHRISELSPHIMSLLKLWIKCLSVIAAFPKVNGEVEQTVSH